MMKFQEQLVSVPDEANLGRFTLNYRVLEQEILTRKKNLLHVQLSFHVVRRYRNSLTDNRGLFFFKHK